MTAAPRATELGLVGCHTCGLTCAIGQTRCPRCASHLHPRKPDSLARSWALLIAALVLYVPSNMLPVMYTSMLGRGEASTILHGVVEFWKAGSWDIALLIFIASVAVPSTKFLVLGMLLVSARRKSPWARPQRARLYRLVELIGYWSMLDVVVVALVCALVQFHLLGTAEPRAGIVFFGLVVVLTMFAAMSFDPRLIWDADDDA
ncbi:MAG: paraquat-inducible protein A [Proteobacteria bacterium]|uniref:paraquat-inducible protein A n=1 Tax=Rudaea sp. TaxID=2136325 RepID=UPI001DE1AE32|nr:paraquat-inducible protein A [Pseudomonadota bacterium]MBS0566255.1 paraquat-inducible protein A [Pseudomonadota bacterium]